MSQKNGGVIPGFSILLFLKIICNEGQDSMDLPGTKRFRRSPLQLGSIFEKYGIFIFLIILFIIASFVSSNFLKPHNLEDILNQSAALGIVAVGQTFVILIGGGGLDLSVAVLSPIHQIQFYGGFRRELILLVVIRRRSLTGFLITAGLNHFSGFSVLQG